MNTQDINELKLVINFFASVIKSGEKWSDECEKQLQFARSIGTPAEDNPHYRLLHHTEPQQLSELVTNAMRKGYVLVGGVSVTEETDSRKAWYAQAVCRVPARAEPCAKAAAQRTINELGAMFWLLAQKFPQFDLTAAQEGKRP